MWRLRCRWGGCCSGRSGLAHSLKLLEGLPVEGRLGGLLGAILVADDLGGLLGELFAYVLRNIEEGELFVALLENVGGIDETRLVEDDLGTVEDEPADGQPDDDGDVDGFAEARTGALIVEGVEEMNELVLFENAVAVRTHLDGCTGRRCGIGRRLERGHELCGCDGRQMRKLRWQERNCPRRCAPVCVVMIIFSSLAQITVRDSLHMRCLEHVNWVCD